MKNNIFKTILSTLAVTACSLGFAATEAKAIVWNWNYTWDSFYDGTGGLVRDGVSYDSMGNVTTGTAAHGVGINSEYEHFGMAYTYDKSTDQVIFAFNSNIPLQGWSESGAKDGNIGWGDLFLNLDETKTFSDVQGSDSLLAIRFAGTNDSGLDAKANNGQLLPVTEQVLTGYKQVQTGTQKVLVNGKWVNQPIYTSQPVYKTVTTKINGSTGETGVYQGVTAKSVTGVNSGWSDYNSFTNYVQGLKIAENGQYLKDAKGNIQKGLVELIDGMTLAQAQSYLGTAYGRGVIDTFKSKLGGITLLTQADLALAEVDFTKQAQKDGIKSLVGTQTFGFSVDRSLFGKDSKFILHVMAECSNDTMGMLVDLNKSPASESVPEPTTLLGMAVAGGALAGAKRRRRQQQDG